MTRRLDLFSVKGGAGVTTLAVLAAVRAVNRYGDPAAVLSVHRDNYDDALAMVGAPMGYDEDVAPLGERFEIRRGYALSMIESRLDIIDWGPVDNIEPSWSPKDLSAPVLVVHADYLSLRRVVTHLRHFEAVLAGLVIVVPPSTALGAYEVANVVLREPDGVIPEMVEIARAVDEGKLAKPDLSVPFRPALDRILDLAR